MKLGISIGYSGGRVELPIDRVLEAEQLDYDSLPVPDKLCDEISLCGPEARIRQRYKAWEECGVTTMIVQTSQREALHLMADITGTKK